LTNVRLVLLVEEDTHPDPRGSTSPEVKPVGHFVTEGRNQSSPIEELDSSFERDGGHGLSLMRSREQINISQARRKGEEEDTNLLELANGRKNVVRGLRSDVRSLKDDLREQRDENQPGSVSERKRTN